MGALIGGVHAAGKLNEFESWVRAITRLDIVSPLDLSWSNNGLVKGDRIINRLVDIVGEKTIEELPISFTAVAADVKNEKEVWLDSGRLFDAIRASISLPLLLTPVKYKQSYLIDGGVLNPAPIAPTFKDDTDITVAVNLGGAVESVGIKTGADTATASRPSPLQDKISRFISDLNQTVKAKAVKDWAAYDIANQAFDAMQATIARQKLAAYPPDIVIEIARNSCGTLEFDRADEMIELGRAKAGPCLEKIHGQR